MGGYNNGVMIAKDSQDSAPYSNAYGYQDAQQARDAYDSFVAEQSMSREGAGGNRAKGGYIGHYAQGGLGSLGGYSDGGRLLRGPGDGVSDSIPASIGNRQPARLADGEFVVPARIVSELGNGSSSAGQDRLRRLGGQPIKGRGDGVSDSVKANIGGRQDARVARDEVKFSPKAVAKLGGGDKKRGADKLYSLMAKAEKARKTAKRGQDTGLASLLGA
jgi:hypothetical protein